MRKYFLSTLIEGKTFYFAGNKSWSTSDDHTEYFDTYADAEEAAGASSFTQIDIVEVYLAPPKP